MRGTKSRDKLKSRLLSKDKQHPGDSQKAALCLGPALPDLLPPRPEVPEDTLQAHGSLEIRSAKSEKYPQNLLIKSTQILVDP